MHTPKGYSRCRDCGRLLRDGTACKCKEPAKPANSEVRISWMEPSAKPARERRQNEPIHVEPMALQQEPEYQMREPEPKIANKGSQPRKRKRCDEGSSDHQVFERNLEKVMSGMTQQQFADMIGVHVNTAARPFTSGTYYYSVPVLVKLARATGVDLNWLLGVDNGNPD